MEPYTSFKGSTEKPLLMICLRTFVPQPAEILFHQPELFDVGDRAGMRGSAEIQDVGSPCSNSGHRGSSPPSGSTARAKRSGRLPSSRKAPGLLRCGDVLILTEMPEDIVDFRSVSGSHSVHKKEKGKRVVAD